MLLSRLDHRVCVAEIMDDPHLDHDQHRSALKGLARINRVSRSAAILWPALSTLARAGPIRVLDLATGSGDIPLTVWKYAQKKKLPIHIDGCDISPTAVAIANQHANAINSPTQFFQMDVLDDEWPQNYDVVTCSLFLHHLASGQIFHLLRKASQQAKQLILFSDLIRCRRGMFLAKLACNLLTKSDVVRVDGPRSVRAALTKKEISYLAERAGLPGFQITSHWPCRFLLQWRRPGVGP